MIKTYFLSLLILLSLYFPFLKISASPRLCLEISFMKTAESRYGRAFGAGVRRLWRAGARPTIC